MAWVLYEGDCLEIMPTLSDKSIDMILCDLPYGTTACSWDVVIPFEPLWAQYERLIKDNGAIVLTASQPFTTLLIASNLKLFKYCWVWEKPQGVDPFMARIRPLNNIEDICIFGKAGVGYNPQMSKGKAYTITRDKRPRTHNITGTDMKQTTTVNKGERYPGRVLRFNQERGLHPTQKPVALFDYLIRTYTNPGDLILDNCAGSGTTGVAAENLGRNSILIEKEPKYCEIIRKRMANRQMTLFEAGVTV